MNRILITSVFILVLSCLALPAATIADGDGPSAKGSFQISTPNGHVQDIKFTAALSSDGKTTGEITFRDGLGAPAAKSVGSSATIVADPPFYAKATCDCLSVSGIEAALVGTITEASVDDYIGRRILLVVQDGDSLTPPLRDKLTYGFYRTIAKGWPATDGERPEEQDPAPTWLATDSERSDDTGVLTQKEEPISCNSIPLGAHSFIASRYGKGNIQVRR